MNSGIQQKADILVVDDVPANLRLLSEILKSEGYRVRPAPNGRLALQSARKQPPDLILLDIRMPDLDGFEVYGKLEADERLREIPVIFITTAADTDDKLKAFNVGGVDYITKPFQQDEVLARVNTHVNLQRYQKELAKKLEVKEEMFRATFEQTAVGLANVTQNGRFLLVNDKLCDMLGYSREELMALTARDIIHPDDMDLHMPEVQSVVRGDKTYEKVEKRYRRKDDSYLWCNLTLSALREKTGAFKHLIIVVEDISERKAIELALARSEKRFRDLMELAPDGIVIVNDHYDIINVNREAEKLFGYHKEEMIGQPMEMLIPVWFVDGQKEFRQKFMSDAEMRTIWSDQDIVGFRKDGSEFPIEIGLGLIETIDGLIATASIRDITVRKNIEDGKLNQRPLPKRRLR